MPTGATLTQQVTAKYPLPPPPPTHTHTHTHTIEIVVLSQWVGCIH